MRILLTAASCLLGASLHVSAQDEPPGWERIDGSSLLERASALASDRLGGRLTASPGQLRAAAMIEAHFEELGLEPLGDRTADGTRSWRQHYPLVRTYVDDQQTFLRLGDETWTDGFGVLPSISAADVAIEGAWVLVDPRGEMPDVKGAIPVVVLPTPRARVRSFEALFSASLTSFLRAKGFARKLARSGAEAVVFCVMDDDSGVTNALNFVGIAPGKHVLKFEGGSPADMARNWYADIPQIFLSSRRSAQVLAALGFEATARGKLEATDAATESDGGLSLAVRVDGRAEGVNVVGFLRGSDPEIAGEALVYSAHMDHVGLRLDGDVYNGADDNASGTAGLMEIAEAFAGLEMPPRRSVIFLAVSGEEQGLWGSQYFCDYPTWPLEDVVANINIDMIGRSGSESEPDEVTVTPSHGHSAFSSLVRDAARMADSMGIGFCNGDKYYTRSDHYHFARNDIPVLFFCSGEHEDYHLATDHADKLDSDKMQRVARLAYWIGYRAAQSDARPEVLGRQPSWTGGR